jgi:hypothetical protein
VISSRALSTPAPDSRQFLDSFVAFLPVSRVFSADSIVRAQALTLAELLRALAHRPAGTFASRAVTVGEVRAMALELIEYRTAM